MKWFLFPDMGVQREISSTVIHALQRPKALFFKRQSKKYRVLNDSKKPKKEKQKETEDEPIDNAINDKGDK